MPGLWSKADRPHVIADLSHVCPDVCKRLAVLVTLSVAIFQRLLQHFDLFLIGEDPAHQPDTTRGHASDCSHRKPGGCLFNAFDKRDARNPLPVLGKVARLGRGLLWRNYLGCKLIDELVRKVVNGAPAPLQSIHISILRCMTCALRLTTNTIQAIDDKIKEFDEIRADVIARIEELSGTVTSASERLDQDVEFVAAFF